MVRTYLLGSANDHWHENAMHFAPATHSEFTSHSPPIGVEPPEVVAAMSVITTFDGDEQAPSCVP